MATKKKAKGKDGDAKTNPFEKRWAANKGKKGKK